MIESMTIKIGDQAIVLTIDEAKQLQSELNALIGGQPCFVPHYIPAIQPYTAPAVPWIEPYHPTVTCKTEPLGGMRQQ